MAVVAAATLWSYTFISPGDFWPAGNVVMQEQLGGGSGTLIDGSASWGQVFESGLAIWNGVLGRLKFQIVRNSTAAIGDGNGTNNVFFSSMIFDRPFDSDTLAVTTNWLNTVTNQRIEADIIFNTGFGWNSYRGNLRSGVTDFRRVAIHESGHVATRHCRGTPTIMNARSNMTPYADDIAGASRRLRRAHEALFPSPQSCFVTS